MIPNFCNTRLAEERTRARSTRSPQRIRHLTHDNQTLEQRLDAARSDNRFADRRIAQLTEHITPM